MGVSFIKKLAVTAAAVVLLTSAVGVFAQGSTAGQSIAIIAPQATGLVEGLEHLPILVQGELVSNFSAFSGMKVLDRENLEKLYVELDAAVYTDEGEEMADLGNLARTNYVLGGRLTRTASGYALQLTITRTAKDDKTTVAAYSGTFPFHELDNLTGVRRASLDLLQKMGVTLTDQAKTALAGAATTNHINAQTALSHGIVAQRQGTEVAALSYFYQAAAFDPSLAEAVGRSSVMAANINSANLGENIRNDIVWRRDWMNRLTQTEETFHKMLNSADPPYTLHYATVIETQNVNYQTETADLSIPINLTANGEWFAAMRKALQAANAVMDGLNATNRKNEWQIGGWPRNGVSQTNPFNRSWSHDILVEFELIDQQGRVIGKQAARLQPSFHVGSDFTIGYTENTAGTVTFNAVKADDISDHLTIRPALVNGHPPETARFPIRAITAVKRQQTIFLRIEDGVVIGFDRSLSAEQKAQHHNLVIPNEAWGRPVTAIADRAFKNEKLISVTIPNSVISIGEGAFEDNRLTDVAIPNSVTNIGSNAFRGNQLSGIIISNSVTSIESGVFENNKLSKLTIPSSVHTIENRAFAGNNITDIVIGGNVKIALEAITNYVGDQPYYFASTYSTQHRSAGTYVYKPYSTTYTWKLVDGDMGRVKKDRRRGTLFVVALLVAVVVVGLMNVD